MLRKIITDFPPAKADRPSYAQVLSGDLTPKFDSDNIQTHLANDNNSKEIDPATEDNLTRLPIVEIQQNTRFQPISSQSTTERVGIKGGLQYCRNCGISFFRSVASCADFCEKGEE